MERKSIIIGVVFGVVFFIFHLILCIEEFFSPYGFSFISWLGLIFCCIIPALFVGFCEAECFDGAFCDGFWHTLWDYVLKPLLILLAGALLAFFFYVVFSIIIEFIHNPFLLVFMLIALSLISAPVIKVITIFVE